MKFVRLPSTYDSVDFTTPDNITKCSVDGTVVWIGPLAKRPPYEELCRLRKEEVRVRVVGDHEHDSMVAYFRELVDIVWTEEKKMGTTTPKATGNVDHRCTCREEPRDAFGRLGECFHCQRRWQREFDALATDADDDDDEVGE